tara:strand:+ start:7951 stop:10107 length:2157 start_codon:yes stop_codon:yes gene_type:complete
MAFGNEIKSASIVENWLFDIAGTSSNTLRFAFSDCTVSSVFYYGVILNKPSIRESINLETSTAKSSNLSITIPDFQYNNGLISEILFGGSIYFINQTVTVKSMINNATPNVIGYFKIAHISRSVDSINIEMITYSPWDEISLPTNKTSTNNYVPIQYGNFTKNENTSYSSPRFAQTLSSIAYCPAPYHKSRGGVEQFSTSIVEQSSNAELAYYDKNLETFIPFTNVISGTISSFASHFKSTTDPLFTRGFNYRPTDFIDHDNQWTNEANVTNTTTTDYALFSKNLNCSGTTSGFTILKASNHLDYIFPKPQGKLKNLTLTVDFTTKNFVAQNVSGDIYTTKIFIDWSGSGDNFELVQTIAVGDASSNYVNRSYSKVYASVGDDGEELDISYPNTIKIAISIVVTDDSAPYQMITTTEIRVKEVYAKVEIINEEADIDFAYCAGDGLPATGWELVNGGSTGLAITRIHEAHRDMLYRFADITTDTGSIDGWSDLATSRSGWLIRYWLLKETTLKNILNKLQYEGGFIFRFKQGNINLPQYIHIKNSYSSSDYTLTKLDISKPTVTITNYKDLNTRADINYNKHPAQNKYETGVRASSSTTRSNYSITAKENISDISLDAYVAPTIDAYTSQVPVENANINDDFFSYYHNCYGEPKIEISANLINPKFFNLDIGDIVDFSNMYPKKIFAKSFTNVAFMITSVTRTLGVLKFKAREVGVIS